MRGEEGQWAVSIIQLMYALIKIKQRFCRCAYVIMHRAGVKCRSGISATGFVVGIRHYAECTCFFIIDKAASDLVLCNCTAIPLKVVI